MTNPNEMQMPPPSLALRLAEQAAGVPEAMTVERLLRGELNAQFLERFAALVAEECAKVCQSRYMGDNNREDMEARRCADAIRAKFKA